MCSECVFRSGEHTNHLQDVVLIKKAFPKVRGRINDLVSEFEKSIRNVKLNEVNLGENKKSLENLNFNCKGQIGKLFDELREALRHREMELITKIESTIDREMKQVDREINTNHERREKIESVFELINSVRDVQSSTGSTSFEKEIEILDAFSEMRSTVAESRAELSRNDVKFVQLYLAPENVSRMQRQIDEIKSAISFVEGIVPSNRADDSVVEPKPIPMKRRNSTKRSGSTQNDLFLMSAIEDAMRAS